MQPTEKAAALAFAMALPAGIAALRAVRARKALYPHPLLTVPPGSDTPPTHDPERLTAVALLNHEGTEVSDLLLPYELLAASDAFNVHAVAPELRPVTLTGGLDVLPHLSFAGFRDLPADRADLIVVPHLPNPDPRIVDWLRQQAGAGAVVLSICTGAAVAAAAGVFTGRTATAHWGDFGILERRYPEVTWVRGTRFVDEGEAVSSAGITSGVDATLHLIRRLAGDAPMRRAAEAIGYSDLRYLEDPAIEQYRPEPADLILPLVAAFGTRRAVGVLLRDAVHETALAAVMDTYAATFTARMLTMTADGGPVRSRHGLTLLPRAGVAEAGSQDRLLLPSAGHLPGRSVSSSISDPDAYRWHAMPQAGPPYDAFADALDDLAIVAGRRIARYAAKRLEHRST